MRKISIILLITGVLTILIPLAGQSYTRYHQNKMMEEWLNNVDAGLLEETAGPEQEEALKHLNEAFLPENIRYEAPEDGETGGGAGEAADGAATDANETSKQTVLGIIQIKKIKIKAPIVEGVKPGNLKSAVGHVPGTAALGCPGNSVLAGHRSYTFGKFFNRLDELVEGDSILITTKEEDLTYKVFETKVVLPDDVSVLKGSKDDTILTLITCTPIYVASHRLIVIARLENRVLKVP